MEMQTRVVRFLIVENDPAIRAQLENLVLNAKLGTTVSASSIREAVDALENELFDVIVSSWDMPGRANGLSILKLVRAEERFRHVGFVLLSSPSEGEPVKVKSARAAHVDGYLLKPIDEKALSNLLAEVASKIPDLT